jgi:hypothetical protein
VPLKSNQTRALRRLRKGSENLNRKGQKPPAIATQPGFSHARTRTNAHCTDACGWEQVKRSTFVTLNVGLF